MVQFDSSIVKMGHFSDLCKNGPVFSNSNLRQGLFRSCVSLARFSKIKKRKQLRKDQFTPYLPIKPVHPVPTKPPVQTQIENPSTRHDAAQDEGGATQGEAQARAGAGADACGAGQGEWARRFAGTQAREHRRGLDAAQRREVVYTGSRHGRDSARL
jgi:hypothetical protein